MRDVMFKLIRFEKQPHYLTLTTNQYYFQEQLLKLNPKKSTDEQYAQAIQDTYGRLIYRIFTEIVHQKKKEKFQDQEMFEVMISVDKIINEELSTNQNLIKHFGKFEIDSQIYLKLESISKKTLYTVHYKYIHFGEPEMILS